MATKTERLIAAWERDGLMTVMSQPREKGAMMGGFLVIGGHSWGWGPTLAEAKARFRANYGHLSDGYGIFTFPPGSEFIGVSQMGFIQWSGKDPTTTIVKARSAK